MKKFTLFCFAVASVAMLASCKLNGKGFVEKTVGYAVTRGKVVRLENLSTERKDHFGDGVGVRVQEAGCVVQLRMGQPVQEIQLKPGSMIVMTDAEDFILQPYPQTNVDQDVDGSATASTQSQSQGARQQQVPQSQQQSWQSRSQSQNQSGNWSQVDDDFGPPAPGE